MLFSNVWHLNAAISYCCLLSLNRFLFLKFSFNPILRGLKSHCKVHEQKQSPYESSKNFCCALLFRSTGDLACKVIKRRSEKNVQLLRICSTHILYMYSIAYTGYPTRTRANTHCHTQKSARSDTTKISAC